MPWVAVETRGQLEDLRMHGPRAWLVYSFPEYMDPELVEGIHQYCRTQQVFPGTLDGGDVIVCTLAGRFE
jgi:hypothetical protein